MGITHTRRTGFTIVELAVVIATIGILASISIVGYGAWRQRTTESTIKNDLQGLKTAMENSRNFSNGYPTSIPTSFSPSTNVNLSYAWGDSTRYCVSATSGTTSYYINTLKSMDPISGSCGAIITNLATNPSIESNINDWTENSGQIVTRSTSWSTNGSASAAVQRASSNTATTFNFRHNAAGAIPALPGQIYTVSADVKSQGAPATATIRIRWNNSATGEAISTPVNLADGAQARISVTSGAAPAGTTSFYIWVTGGGITTPTQIFYIDSLIATQGTAKYNYADGGFVSQGWTWLGTQNNSTSSGPAL